MYPSVLAEDQLLIEFYRFESLIIAERKTKAQLVSRLTYCRGLIEIATELILEDLHMLSKIFKLC